jgi:selenocysteine lyase/cysteine desulfurase
MTGPALVDLSAAFDRVPGYLDAATMGLPPRVAAEALRQAVTDWQAGRSTAVGYDAAVAASRSAYARIVGVVADDVAVGSQVSALVGTVAASLPDGAEVLTVEGDFASVVFPLLVHADRGVRVRAIPLEHLAEQVRPGTALVAWSLVQSADGRVAPEEILRAAADVGALTLCDVTQAVGWLPVRAADYDVTVCAAYKWLCSPRGVAFMTVRPGVVPRLRPVLAGWYAGDPVWDSIYGPTMTLAPLARRFDVSPAWLTWVGAVPALELFADADADAVRAHDAGLADAVRAGLDADPTGSAVLSLADPDGTLVRRFTAAGLRVAGRAGRLRVAFHVWNDEEDAARVLDLVRGEASPTAG